MSAPAPATFATPEQFRELVDQYAPHFGLRPYTDVEIGAEDLAIVATDLYAALRILTDAFAAVEVNLRQGTEAGDEEALERATLGRRAGNDALRITAERADLRAAGENVLILELARARRPAPTFGKRRPF